MAISNEQRAHDLAISMIPATVEYQKEKEYRVAIENSAPVEKVKLTELYWDMYNSALKKLNELNIED